MFNSQGLNYGISLFAGKYNCICISNFRISWYVLRGIHPRIFNSQGVNRGINLLVEIQL